MYLHNEQIVRSTKKQKVFYWNSIPHHDLLIAAVNREVTRRAFTNFGNGEYSTPSLSDTTQARRRIEQMMRPILDAIVSADPDHSLSWTRQSSNIKSLRRNFQGRNVYDEAYLSVSNNHPNSMRSTSTSPKSLQNFDRSSLGRNSLSPALHQKDFYDDTINSKKLEAGDKNIESLLQAKSTVTPNRYNRSIYPEEQQRRGRQQKKSRPCSTSNLYKNHSTGTDSIGRHISESIVGGTNLVFGDEGLNYTNTLLYPDDIYSNQQPYTSPTPQLIIDFQAASLNSKINQSYTNTEPSAWNRSISRKRGYEDLNQYNDHNYMAPQSAIPVNYDESTLPSTGLYENHNHRNNYNPNYDISARIIDPYKETCEFPQPSIVINIDDYLQIDKNDTKNFKVSEKSPHSASDNQTNLELLSSDDRLALVRVAEELEQSLSRATSPYTDLPNEKKEIDYPFLPLEEFNFKNDQKIFQSSRPKSALSMHRPNNPFASSDERLRSKSTSPTRKPDTSTEFWSQNWSDSGESLKRSRQYSLMSSTSAELHSHLPNIPSLQNLRHYFKPLKKKPLNNVKTSMKVNDNIYKIY